MDLIVLLGGRCCADRLSSWCGCAGMKHLSPAGRERKRNDARIRHSHMNWLFGATRKRMYAPAVASLQLALKRLKPVEARWAQGPEFAETLWLLFKNWPPRTTSRTATRHYKRPLQAKPELSRCAPITGLLPLSAEKAGRGAWQRYQQASCSRPPATKTTAKRTQTALIAATAQDAVRSLPAVARHEEGVVSCEQTNRHPSAKNAKPPSESRRLARKWPGRPSELPAGNSEELCRNLASPHHRPRDRSPGIGLPSGALVGCPAPLQWGGVGGKKKKKQKKATSRSAGLVSCAFQPLSSNPSRPRKSPPGSGRLRLSIRAAAQN